MVDMNQPGSDPRAAAAARLRARAERLRAIRRRVAATALATFAIAFGVIGLTGSMGTGAATFASTNAAPATSTSSSTGTSTGTSSQGWSHDATPSSSGSAGAPMTTSQS
jgi:hypothetical protein